MILVAIFFRNTLKYISLHCKRTKILKRFFFFQAKTKFDSLKGACKLQL